MSDTARALIDDFLRDGWEAEPMARALALPPEQVRELALIALAEVSRGGTFLDAALSFLADEDWPAVVAAAVAALSGEGREVAEAVIAYASLQRPAALAPHAPQLVELAPSAEAYYAGWIWRGADESARALLVARCAEGAPAARLEAWRGLLETRDERALREALERWPAVADSSRLELSEELHAVGFEPAGAGARRLYWPRALHVSLPAGAHPEAERHRHPTWSLERAEGTETTFGGADPSPCARCGGSLHRLLRVDAAWLDPAAEAGPLQLATCTSCLGWESDALFVRHDAAGAAQSWPIDERERGEPDFPAEGLAELPVRLIDAGPRWRWQDWALSNGRENLSRLGGYPSWVQCADYPACPACGETMRFLLQLDSDLPDRDGEPWQWGSGGLLYAFLCSPCRVSATLWQCT